MIVQIRGTSGSGKTWAMRSIMSLLGSDWVPFYVDAGVDNGKLVEFEGRKKPLGYYLREYDMELGNSRLPIFPPRIIVLGHYEAVCGGCDNIGSARAVYDVIDAGDVKGCTCRRIIGGAGVVLTEGLLLSEDTKWTLQMSDVRCFFLNTPVDKCLDQIKARRQEAGNEKELNHLNTTKRVNTIERARVKLTEAGVWCRRASARQLPELVVNLLTARVRA